jgi:hypothetical protein
MGIDDAWRYKLIGSLAEFVTNPLTVYHGIEVSWQGVHIYQLEDGRYSVSVFGESGEHKSEELFADPFVAAARFYAYVEAH